MNKVPGLLWSVLHFPRYQLPTHMLPLLVRFPHVGVHDLLAIGKEHGDTVHRITSNLLDIQPHPLEQTAAVRGDVDGRACLIAEL